MYNNVYLYVLIYFVLRYIHMYIYIFAVTYQFVTAICVSTRSELWLPGNAHWSELPSRRHPGPTQCRLMWMTHTYMVLYIHTCLYSCTCIYFLHLYTFCRCLLLIYMPYAIIMCWSLLMHSFYMWIDAWLVFVRKPFLSRQSLASQLFLIFYGCCSTNKLQIRVKWALSLEKEI